MKARGWSLLFLLALAWSARGFVSAQSASSYDALIQQGNTQLKAGNADQALSVGQSAEKIDADRWEGYALAGGALMNLKRYDDAADALSKAIERAPEDKQPALRDLRRKCLIMPSDAEPVEGKQPAMQTTQAEIVLWKSIEKSTNPTDFQSYLDQYPQGVFATQARQQLALKSAASRFELLNQCDKTIEIALMYLPVSSDSWRISGWYVAQPGLEIALGAPPIQAQGTAKAYYYARKLDKVFAGGIRQYIEWDDAGKPGSIAAELGEGFNWDIPHPASGYKLVHFSVWETNGNSGLHTMTVRCQGDSNSFVTN
jgi:tetratricopeptide (TPR) repeat protein